MLKNYQNYRKRWYIQTLFREYNRLLFLDGKFKYNDEERKMDLNCGITEIMINDKEDTVIEELFQSLLSRHKIGLKTSMKGRDLINVIYHITNAIK